MFYTLTMAESNSYFTAATPNFFYFRVLQSTALERLKARSIFSQSGQMTFTLKLTKAFKKGNEKQLQVTVDANLNGDYLAKEIAALVRFFK